LIVNVLIVRLLTVIGGIVIIPRISEISPFSEMGATKDLNGALLRRRRD